MKVRVNVGCGQTPTPGWRNFDNSFTLRLAGWPLAAGAAARLGFLDGGQRGYLEFLRSSGVAWADATRRIPLKDGAADVVYTSHMVEHLDRDEAADFLAEARRVLCEGGIIRVAVPDVGLLIEKYLSHGDADRFVEETFLAVPRKKGLLARLKYSLVGSRNHLWMYDAQSLSAALARAGFHSSGHRFLKC